MSQTSPAAALGFARLRFRGPLESSFSEYWFTSRLRFTQLGIVLTIVLYALFGILDRVIVPSVAGSIWLIRYAIVCPIFLAALAFSFTRWFKPVMQLTVSALAVVAGLGIVAIIVIAGVHGGALYYAGLLLVIPGSFAVLQLRFLYGTAACAVIIAGYELAAIWLTATPFVVLVNNNFFLLASVVISMLAGYTIERGLRTDFLQRRVIESQREQLANHNVQLDSALGKSLEEVRRQAKDLQASRARIVATADNERRRIERNLHDGAQQQLAAMTIRLRLAAKAAQHGMEAKRLFNEFADQLQETIQELRRLAHGIYPPLLREEGIAAALSSATRRSAIPVTVEAFLPRRYPPEVEANVYFCCLEALQNASKHAGEGATVKIRVREDAHALLFDVTDDGVGFNSAAANGGVGFTNMNDRVGALGGKLCVESAPGHGTRVSGEIPLQDEGGSQPDANRQEHERLSPRGALTK